MTKHGVITGFCVKTKSTEKTAGRIAGGMPYRIPLVQELGHEWYQGFKDDAIAIAFTDAVGEGPWTPEMKVELGTILLGRSDASENQVAKATGLGGRRPAVHGSPSEVTCILHRLGRGVEC